MKKALGLKGGILRKLIMQKLQGQQLMSESLKGLSGLCGPGKVSSFGA